MYKHVQSCTNQDDQMFCWQKDQDDPGLFVHLVTANRTCTAKSVDHKLCQSSDHSGQF